MTRLQPLVRQIRESDLDGVQELVRGSFDPGLRPFMAATQHGWAEHMRIKLAHPGLHPGQHLAVVEEAGAVVAFGDYRTNAGAGFLSYICVAPGARGRGLARALFAWLVEQGRPVERVSLDVFDDNAPALRMYGSMGFHEQNELTWWSSGIEPGLLTGTDQSLDVDCPDLHVSVAALERFGFCQIQARVGDHEVTFGRLGRTVVRVPSLDGPHERRLLGALSAAVRDIEIVFMVSPGGGPPAELPHATRLTAAVRMDCLNPSLITLHGGPSR